MPSFSDSNDSQTVCECEAADLHRRRPALSPGHPASVPEDGDVGVE